MAYKELEQDDFVNSVEFNLKEFVEQELDAYYVFDIEDSFKAVQTEPYKPVIYFQLADVRTLKENGILSNEGHRGDIINLSYTIFVLLNDEYGKSRDINRASNNLVDTLNKNKHKLLDYFENIYIGNQADNATKSPNGFKVNKHMMNSTAIKKR